MQKQIIVRELDKPKEVSTQDDIEWVCDSLGFVAGRDTHRMSSRIVQALLHDMVDDGFSSSEGIADELDIASQRVNYHLRSLIESGLVYRNRRMILLRDGSLRSAIEEMRRDANRIFDNLVGIASEIDNALGLKNRAKD